MGLVIGMPHNLANRMGEHLHKGDALVIVHALDDASVETAQAILASHHPRVESAPDTGGIFSVNAST
ncbi:MAG: hypothetical protein M1337_07240 [Actinobacteria bacterium]|nr:hypothetical protein [Actinomycetota bacterium]